jgi:hypothetical protein
MIVKTFIQGLLLTQPYSCANAPLMPHQVVADDVEAVRQLQR